MIIFREGEHILGRIEPFDGRTTLDANNAHERNWESEETVVDKSGQLDQTMMKWRERKGVLGWGARRIGCRQ